MEITRKCIQRWRLDTTLTSAQAPTIQFSFNCANKSYLLEIIQQVFNVIFQNLRGGTFNKMRLNMPDGYKLEFVPYSMEFHNYIKISLLKECDNYSASFGNIYYCVAID